MKKKSLALTLMLAFSCILGGDLMGQSSVCTYGDDASSSSHSYSPYGGVSNWEYYVFLYDAANVDFEGIITNVSFKGGADVAASDDIHYTMYLKDVPSGTTLSSSTSTKYATYLNGATLVLPRTSTPAISKDAWNSTTLTTSFEHAQGNSLLVLIKADGKTLQHKVYYMSNSNHVWYYKADVTSDPGTNITGTLTSMVPSIKLTYTPVACPKPKALNATSITKNSATLGWTSDAESFNIQYKATNAENWTTVEDINTNSYTLDGILSPRTTYQFQVQAVCSGTPGNYSNPVSFTTSYTLPYTMGFEDSEMDEFNALWQVVSTSSNTGQYRYASHAGSRCFRFYYVNASQYLITPLLDATGGSISFYYKNTSNTNERTFKFGFSTTSNDVNNDFTWDESATTAEYNVWNEYTNTFPAGTKYIAILSNPQSLMSDLQIDDITINAPSEISKPTNLSVSAVSYTSAQFNWTAGGSETNWKLQYKKTADASWTTVDVSSKPHKISTLDENSTYQWRVAAYIAPNMSDYEPGDNFTTPAQYPAPTGLTTSNIKTSGATLSWNETTGADGYNLRYSVSSPEDWTTASGLTEETYTIGSGLTGNTAYKIQVQAIYGENTSAWAEYSFTTLPVKRYTATSEYESMNNWNYSFAWTPSYAPEVNHDVVIEQNAKILSNNTAVANDVTINAGVTLTIRSNAILTCNNITNNGTLVIEDGGQLICNNAVNATVHKTIAAWDEGSTDGWYFIASPINVSDLAPTNVTNMISDANAANGDRTYDLYSLENITWHNYRAKSFNLANGQGYLYASEEGADLQFSGAIKAYDANHTISVSEGWNLIGNPYTFEAYPNQAYYTINDANSGITAQTSTSSAVVAPCTGIIVKAAEDGTVKFLKDAPETSANNGNIQMVLAHKVATRDGASVNKNIDNAIVSFNEGSQLEKFYFGNPSASIFIPQNGEDYAIVFSDRQGDVPLYFKANETGTYTISFAGDEMSLNGIYLIDILAEEEIDLSVNPSYTFIGSPADRMARFKIVFRNTGGDGTSDIFAYQSGNDIIVSGEGELQIFDVMGRMVSTQRVNGVETVNVKSQGVYIFRLNDKTQKIVVR